jgi:hypothetical protein
MNIARIKLGAAAVLLACLALPEYTCSKFIGPDGKEVYAGPEGVPATPYRKVQENHYPLESFSVRDFGSWLVLLAFVWPWPILVYWLRRRQSRGTGGALNRVVWLAEPPLAMGSGYLIWAFSSLGTRAAGAYVALAANAVYLGAWVAELLKNRPWRKVPRGLQ